MSVAAAAGQQQPERSDDTGCLDAETVSSTGSAANIWSCFIKSQFRARAIRRLQSSQVDRAADTVGVVPIRMSLKSLSFLLLLLLLLSLLLYWNLIRWKTGVTPSKSILDMWQQQDGIYCSSIVRSPWFRVPTHKSRHLVCRYSHDVCNVGHTPTHLHTRASGIVDAVRHV